MKTMESTTFLVLETKRLLTDIHKTCRTGPPCTIIVHQRLNSTALCLTPVTGAFGHCNKSYQMQAVVRISTFISILALSNFSWYESYQCRPYIGHQFLQLFHISFNYLLPIDWEAVFYDTKENLELV